MIQFTISRLLLATFWCALAISLLVSVRNLDGSWGDAWDAILVLAAVAAFGAGLGAVFGKQLLTAFVVTATLVLFFSCGVPIYLVFVRVIWPYAD